jgi:mRNA interferase MazF
MARFVSGEIVVLPFPFTDLMSSKVRPALVLASLSRGDIILAQITSRSEGHPEAVPIEPQDLEAGGTLTRASFVLPHRLVTANESCIRRSVAKLKSAKLDITRDRVCATIREK